MDSRLKSLAVTSMAHFANDGTALLFPVLITYYVKLPGVPLSYLTIMVVVDNLISGLLSTPVGRLADSTGAYGKLIALGITLLGISSLIFALPFIFLHAVFPLILAGAVFLGAGQAFYHPLGATILRSTFEGRSSPRAMGVNGSFGSLGRAIVPSLLVFLMTFVGESVGLIIYSGYSFAMALLLYLGLREFEVVRKKPTNAGKYRNSVDRETLGAILPFVYTLTAAVFVRSLFLAGTSTIVPTFLDLEYNSQTQMATVLTIAYLLPVIGQPIFGSLTARKGGRYTVVATFILSTIFFGLFLLFSHQIVGTVIFLSLYAFAAFSGFPVFLGYVGQVVPSEISGISNALVWGVGGTIGGAVGGGAISILLFYRFSPGQTIEIMFIFALVSLAFLPFLPSRKKLEERSATLTQQ